MKREREKVQKKEKRGGGQKMEIAKAAAVPEREAASKKKIEIKERNGPLFRLVKLANRFFDSLA